MSSRSRTPPSPQPWSRQLFSNELKNPISYEFIARLEEGGTEEIAGYTVFWIVAGEAHILNLAVADRLRRMGIASRLIDFTLSLMTEMRVMEVRLEVRRSNVEAILLYEGYGFEEEYVRKKYYGDEDAIVMKLVLTPEELWEG